MMEDIKEIVKWYELQKNAVEDAELRVGFSFPESLSYIYRKYGYGFVVNQEGAINRLIDPMTCADIRLREDVYEFDSDLELYASFEKDKMLFFEVNEGVYLSIEIEDGKIYYLNKQIADNIFEFIMKISNNPDYWCE